MIVTWSDLTKAQRRLVLRLAKADESFSHEDAVGLPADAIPAELLSGSGSLCWLKVIEKRRGWNGRVWLRLTEAGRQVEDGGGI